MTKVESWVEKVYDCWKTFDLAENTFGVIDEMFP